MCGTAPSSELSLDDKNGSSCSCCASEPSSNGQSAAPTDSELSSSFGLTGLTCGGCANTVKRSVSALPGVKDVNVDVVAGGTSTLTITAEGRIEAQSVADVVSEAGYALAER